jgi:hypothetical protein
MERDEEDEDERHSCHTSNKCIVDRKRKPPKKSSGCHSTFREQKISWLAFLAIAIDSPACAKAYFSALRKNMDGILLVFKRRNGGFSFRS